MRRLLSLLVVLSLIVVVLTAFVPATVSAAELSSLSAPTDAGAQALLPPNPDPSWFWWASAPPAWWTCTWGWPSYCAGPSLLAPWIPALGMIW